MEPRRREDAKGIYEMRNFGESTSPELEQLAQQVVDAAYHVYRALGPGLLESVYEMCLFHELTLRGLRVQRQLSVPVRYRDMNLATGLVIDLLVEEQLVVELKAVEKHNPLYEAQVLTYLKLANKKLGLLINFNVTLFKEGVRRVILSR
jgi:GxxExxY protein